MGKRSPGHIEQLPSRSWRVKVYGGTDPLTGREIRLRKTCKTEPAAQIELGKLLEQAAAGRQPSVANVRDPPPRHSGRRAEHRVVRVVADPDQQCDEHVERLLRKTLHLPECAGLQIGPVAHAWVRRSRM
jgi:hypothetical protein